MPIVLVLHHRTIQIETSHFHFTIIVAVSLIHFIQSPIQPITVFIVSENKHPSKIFLAWSRLQTLKLSSLISVIISHLIFSSVQIVILYLITFMLGNLISNSKSKPLIGLRKAPTQPVFLYVMPYIVYANDHAPPAALAAQRRWSSNRCGIGRAAVWPGGVPCN